MVDLESPRDFKFNRGLIADPEAFARDANAASWLFLCSEEFAATEGWMSYASVQAAVAECVSIVSDPPGCSTWGWVDSTSPRSTGCHGRPS